MKPLAFSSEHLSIYTTAITKDLAITKPSTVVNLSDTPVSVKEDGSTFSLLQSRLLKDTSLVGSGATVIVIQTANDNFTTMPAGAKRVIENTWSYANPLAEDTDQHKKLAVHTSNVLKTTKATVNGYRLFFCYLPAGTQGRIHRIHDLYEVHTQIIGTGKMEKYKTESPETVFETAHMGPGYTHYPYYNADRVYP